MVKCILSSESCQLMRDQIYMNAAYDFSIILQSDRCAVHITERRMGSQIGRRDMAHVRQSRPDSVRVPTFERMKRGILCISGSVRRPPRTSSPGTRRSTGSRQPRPHSGDKLAWNHSSCSLWELGSGAESFEAT